MPAYIKSLLNALIILAVLLCNQANAQRILFIGNSFTYGDKSGVNFYRANSVTDLNARGIGGVPALFKAFSMQAGLTFQVALETEPGVGIDWHVQHKRDVIMQERWDNVVLQSFSTLDKSHPGNPATLIKSVADMTQLLKDKNPAVQIDLVATWARADQIYKSQGAWWGKSVAIMTQDIHDGYVQAFEKTPNLHAVAPVGLAWLRAMNDGIATPNPYQPSQVGQINLWSFDNYHASNDGYYLEALVVFGTVTGINPQLLGQYECAGHELGMSFDVIKALQKVAYEQLLKENKITITQLNLPNNTAPAHCHF